MWLYKPLLRRLSCFVRRSLPVTPWLNPSSGQFVPGVSGMQLLGEVEELQVSTGVAGMPNGAGGRLQCGLVCAELGTRGQFVEREIFSVFVGGHARSYPGNKMNGFLWFFPPDS